VKIFTILADFFVYSIFKMQAGLHLTDSVHFFIEDTTKIFGLLCVMIYVIAFIRANVDVEYVRKYLAGKTRFFGYFMASVFGAITPFCSCSSIPLFFAFTQARIPIGITMSFLVTSPIINEVAVLLLASMLGIKFAITYVIVGMVAGIISGIFFDLIKAEKYLLFIHPKAQEITEENLNKRMTLKERHLFAKDELKVIFIRVWKWVIIGVGIGALIHGFVPSDFILKYFGSNKFLSVPLVVLFGIPLYSNATGMIPIATSLLAKGLPVGTTLAFMMSTVAASLPEFIMLKQIMRTKLLVIFFLLLLVLFTIIGWIFNFIW
jgi:hypothetical protein